MSLLGNYMGSGEYSGAGLALLRNAKANQITPQEVAEQQRIEGRIELLQKEVYDLAATDPTVLVELAQEQTDDDEMLRAALGAVGTVGVENMIKNLQGMSKEEQRGLASTMPQAKRDALEMAGWEIPKAEQRHWYSPVKDVAGAVAGTTLKYGGKGLSAVTALPGVKQTLGAMDWVNEAAGNPNRVVAMSDSSKRLMDETGMSAQQIEQQFGIGLAGEDIETDDLMNADVAGSVVALAGGDMPAAVGLITNPKDLWRGAQAMLEVGKEGDDDILPELQYQVYQDLDAAFGEIEGGPSAKEMLRWAKKLSQGMSLDELVEDEESTDPEALRAMIGQISITDGFRNAMSKLEGGRSSAGRNFARRIWADPTLDTRQGGAKWASGAFDAVYTVAADPTMAVGTISKATKAARWGFKGAEGGEKLDRWQQMVRALDAVDNARGLDKADDVVRASEEALTRLAGGKRRLLQSAVAEAEAVRRPALAVQEAMKTGDFGKLVKQYPGFMKHLDDMIKYNDDLKAMKLPGIEDDAAQLFEYYKYASDNRNIVGAVRGRSTRSTKLFGHDGGGHLVVPHKTRIQVWRATQNAKFQSIAFGSVDELPTETLDELKRGDDEAAAELAKERGDLDDEILEEAETMHVNPVTLAYEKKPPNALQEKLHTLYKLATEKVPERGFVRLDGEDAADDFRKLNETLGFIEGSNDMLRRERFNRFVKGSTLDRHMLVNEMIFKMADAAGIRNTLEGEELLARYAQHTSHIYGIHDEVSQIVDGQRLTARQAVLKQQLADGISVPSMKEMLIAARKDNGLRRMGITMSGNVRKSILEAGMSRVWKPGVVMRVGFPMRAGLDEALQTMMRSGARGYLRTAVVEKWAGVAKYDAVSGKIISRGAEGAIKPVRSFTRMMSTMAGGTDEAIERVAFEELAKDLTFIQANAQVKRQMLKARTAEIGPSALKKLPRTMRAIDDFAWATSLRGSELFHKVAKEGSLMTRQGWAEFMLKHSSDYQKTIKNRRLLAIHPQGQQEAAEVVGHSFNGLRPNETHGPGMELLMDRSSPSGYKAVPVITDRGTYKWSEGMDDPMTYLNMGHWMQSMAKSPESRAAMRELAHHVPQSVLDDIGGSLDDLIEMRDLLANDPMLRTQMAHAVNSEASRESIIKTFTEELDVSEDSMAAISDILNGWDEFSPKTKFFLTDDTLSSDRLTADLATAQDRAANAVYNAFRRLDEQDTLRSMVRTQVVDGNTVAEPLKRNHTRVYAPMLDRRAAEDLVRMFQEPDMAQAFAEALERQLKQRNLFGEMKAIWNGAPPGEGGYDLATWMAGIKANLIQGDSSYISAMMAGSSNYSVAEAMRDALSDVIPEFTLRPTIGYMDVSNGLFDTPRGIKRVSDSSVAMMPHQVSGMKAIDPDNVVKQVHVQLADGTKKWVGENELSQLGRIGRMESFDVKRVNRSRSMIRFDKANNRVQFNSKLIDQDFKDGMAFLKGEGGNFKIEKAAWKWTDESLQREAMELEQWLNELGLADNLNMTIEDLVGLYRTKQMRSGPLPMQDVMEDNDRWEEFVELAEAADTGKAKRVVEEWVDDATAQESKLVKAALDEMGIDIADLGLKRKDYKKLLIEREKAHAGLDPAGFGRTRSMSREAIEREKDALAIAIQRSKLEAKLNARAQAKIDDLKNQLDAATQVDDADEIARLQAELDKAPTPPSDRVRVALKGEANDYRIIGEVWGTGVTEDAAVRRSAQHVLDEVNHVFVGKESGEIHHQLIGPLLRDEFTEDMLWRSTKLTDLPDKAFGPVRVVGQEMRWDRLVHRYFQGYAEPAIGAISRMPMWNSSFDKAMDAMEHVYTNHIVRSVDDAGSEIIRKLGLDPSDFEDTNHLIFRQLKNDPKFGDDVIDPVTDYARAMNDGDFAEARAQLSELGAGEAALHLSDEELQTLTNWHKMHATAMEAQVDRAAKRATEMVQPYIDDHRIRSGLQEFMGPVFLPFFYAEEQFLRRFARGLYETPHMIRRGQLAMNGLRSMGVVRTDEYGNEIIVIPGSELLMGTVADLATQLTGNEAYQILDQPLAMGTEFALPGWNTNGESRWAWGPLIGLPKAELGKHFPELGWVSERDQNRKAWEWLLPTSVTGAYKAFIRDPDPAKTASAQLSAIGYLEANGKGLFDQYGPSPTATQRQKYMQDVNQVARMVGVLRYATGQLSGFTAEPIDQGSIFRQEFIDILATGVDYEEAVSTFIERHDDMDNPIAYTVFASKNETGAPIPTTPEAYQFMRENGDLLTDYPTSAVWLMPQEDTGDVFDRRAYNEQLALGLRSQKAPDEVIDQIFIKQAAEMYFDMKGEYDSKRRGLVVRRDNLKGSAKQAVAEEIKVLDQEWSTRKAGYMAQHPVFAESLTPEASDRRKETIEDLEWMIAAGIGGDQAEILEPLLSKYLEFQRVYASYGSQSSKAAKEMKQADLDRYHTEMWALVQEDSRRRDFWNSIILPEMPDNIDPLTTTAKLTGV